MPIWELIYTSKLYNKYIKKNKLNIYSDHLIHLPVPKLVVFYNGTKDREDAILRLSDSFLESSDTNVEADISVNVKMININYGKNKDFLNKCKILEEYSWFIDKIRIFSERLEVSEAVNLALKEMPDDYSMKSFLLAHKAEVTDMCITEYNEAETLQAIGEVKYAEAKEEDIDFIKKAKDNGIISEDVAKYIIDGITNNKNKS